MIRASNKLMTGQEARNLTEEMIRLINALQALLPSRNYIVQFLMMIPRDWPTIYDLFPDFLYDPKLREALKNIFGLEYGYKLQTRADGFGYKLVMFINEAFSFLSNSVVRKHISKLTGISETELINPRREWFEARVEGILNSPDGKRIRKILKTLANTKEPYRHWRSKRDLSNIHGLNIEELDVVLRYPLVLGIVVAQSKNGESGYMLSKEFDEFPDIINKVILSEQE